MHTRPITEIVACGVVATFCIILSIQAWKLPPGTFEPLGSGPIPLVTAGIVILCCLVIIVSRVRMLVGHGGVGRQFRNEFMSRSPYGPLVTLGLTVIYVTALDLKVASFGVITFVFLTILISALENFRVKAFLPALIVSAIVSFGVEYMFTNVFVVDLPA